jgi:hypothetical protein
MKVNTHSISSAVCLSQPSTVSGGGKQKKLITYMTFADGRKIVVPTWPRSRYEGLADMEVGCRIRVTYDKNRAGTLCVRKVERLLDHNEQKALCSIMIPKSRL